MPKLFIFGLGYSAKRIAQRAQSLGWEVVATGSEGKLSFDDTDAVRAELSRADAVLSSVPPDRESESDPVLERYGAALGHAWIGYISSTGVYGDRQGGWVDEDSATDASGPRGRARIEAEAGWRELAEGAGLALHIFRLAGIYGPGRGPFDKVRNGTARRIVKPGQVFSRIHVADIVQVLLSSIEAPRAGAIYNLCDDDPAPPQDVIAHAAELLGMPVPPEVPFDRAEMTPMARSFYADSKRVRNDRIKDELGIGLLYPDYRSGLRALLRDEAG